MIVLSLFQLMSLFSSYFLRLPFWGGGVRELHDCPLVLSHHATIQKRSPSSKMLLHVPKHVDTVKNKNTIESSRLDNFTYKIYHLWMKERENKKKKQLYFVHQSGNRLTPLTDSALIQIFLSQCSFFHIFKQESHIWMLLVDLTRGYIWLKNFQWV